MKGFVTGCDQPMPDGLCKYLIRLNCRANEVAFRWDRTFHLVR